ncbi:MAG: hypothetical protein KY456_01070 [Chloroflexi bacterium]|nr:hypothetical protein [Chloroflexota bacterium]
MDTTQEREAGLVDERARRWDGAPIPVGVGTLAVLVGAAHLVFIVGPPLLAAPVPSFPSLRVGDVLDVITPLVVVPLAGLLFLMASPRMPSALALLGFVVIAIAWVEGQAMHLAANAIGHHVVGDASLLSTFVTYLDEDLSHQIWHGAVLGLAAMTMYRATAGPGSRVAARTTGGAIAGALLFGFTYFLMVVEGRTAVGALPAAAVLAIAGVVAARGGVFRRPALVFYVLAFIVALALAVTWAALNGWRLVEFSEVFDV